MHPRLTLGALPLLLVAASGCRTADKPDADSAGLGADLPADDDGDGYDDTEDCDDADASTNPGATEVCDGVDNDCDGAVDEGVMDTWYADADADGYGDPGAATDACDAPPGHAPTATDCDDTDPAVYPSAAERCDGVDNDCDGDVDEDVQGTWFADADADGFGDAGAPLDSCDPPDGFVADDEDCDDTEPTTNPDGIEVCDDQDNDCDGLTDEADATDAPTWFADVDGDGYGDPDNTAHACDVPTGFVDQARDCDDRDFDISPDADEVCDGVDNDCDGLTDDADPSLDRGTGGTWYADTDADGHGDAGAPSQACTQPTGTVTAADDCDDTDPAVSPSATEICNGIDDDCDGDTDDDDASVDTATGATWYADTDADGHGDPSASSMACGTPAGSVADATDCDDTDPAVSPSATEVCNGIDDDCDGDIDDDDASVDTATGATWYADADTDGYGDPGAAALACLAPAGSVSDATDCDDTDAAVHPAAAEICNGIDDDCDGDIDDADASVDTSTGDTWYRDADGDGYGDPAASRMACAAPSGGVADATDCDDTLAGVHPGATESCDGVDEDCDGATDEGVLGSGLSCPATSCAAVHADQPTAGDDTYTLMGDSGAVFDAWCDMTKNGGGWTLVGSIVNDGTRRWNTEAVFTDTTTFGAAASAQTADHKAESWHDIPGDDLMVQTAGYDMSFDAVLGGWSMADFIAAEYDSAVCSQSYLADGADWVDGLTADQAAAQNVIVRPLDSNAGCFPGTNEQVMLGFQAATCCWVGGAGNTPGGQAQWRTHDGSFVQASTMAVTTCAAGVYPCNANGKVLRDSSFCYDASCKETWAELYVR